MALSRLQESATLLAFPGAASLRIAAALKAHRLPELLTAQLLRACGGGGCCEAQDTLAAALAARLKFEPLDLASARGILLIGAKGAGKSAVAARLAAGAHDIGRPARILPAQEGLALFRAATLPADELVVMEAEGFHPLNPRARGAFGALSDIEGVESVGVISAAADAEDTAETVAAFRYRRLIVTGLDRTRRLGALIAAAAGGARLAHVLRGPQAPLECPDPAALAAALLEPLEPGQLR